MDDIYELRKNLKNQWEVAHYWSDGVTVQVYYFASFKEARDYFYLKVKGVSNVSY